MTFIPWQWAIFTLTADYLYNWPFDNTTQPVSMAVRETLPHSVEGKVPQQLDFWDLNNTSIQTGYMLPEHCLASSKIHLHIPFLSLRLLVSFSVTKWRKSFKRDSNGQRKLSQGGHITVLILNTLKSGNFSALETCLCWKVSVFIYTNVFLLCFHKSKKTSCDDSAVGRGKNR